MAAKYPSELFLFQKFNMLTIVEDLGSANITRKRRVMAVCDCGVLKEYGFTQVQKGRCKSCGCIKLKPFYDVVGNKYGSLTVVEELMRQRRSRMVLVQCDCGNRTMVDLNNLESGNTKSCGCVGRKKTSELRRTHGLSKHLLYGVLGNIRSRCTNPNVDEYKNYGARGICICKEWLNDFLSFYNWCIKNGWREGLTVERIDNDGHYEPLNCKIAPDSVQARNKRNNIYLEYNGRNMVVADWSNELGIPFTTITQRLRMDLPIQMVLSTTYLKRGTSKVPRKEYMKKN